VKNQGDCAKTGARSGWLLKQRRRPWDRVNCVSEAGTLTRPDGRGGAKLQRGHGGGRQEKRRCKKEYPLRRDEMI